MRELLLRLAVASGVGVLNGFAAFFRVIHDGLDDAGCLDFDDEDVVL